MGWTYAEIGEMTYLQLEATLRLMAAHPVRYMMMVEPKG
jgi:hypothetical protein